MAGIAQRSTSRTVATAAEILERIEPALHRTLTWDRGVEMANNADLTELCDIDAYFADPHSPWQRPNNENGNGLIRRHVSKSTNLAVYTLDELRAIEDHIKTMPRAACTGQPPPTSTTTLSR